MTSGVQKFIVKCIAKTKVLYVLMEPELHVNAPLLAPLAAHELLAVCVLQSSKHLFCQRLPVLTKAQKY